MASVTILSDNGATSGSAGLKTSGGNDGVLLLQTTTSGGTPTTAISISNTQVVTYTNQPTYTGGTANGVLYLNGSKAVTSGTALVFDGTNLGIGVSPSSTRATWNQLSIGSSLNITADKTGVGGANYFHNVYNTGSSYYLTNGPAEYYQMYNGAHVWYNAPSGTAGAAVSFTQAMTLDASGNLGVGTTSPSTRLHLYNSAGSNIEVRCQSAYAGGSYIDFGTHASGTNHYAYGYGNVPFVIATNALIRQTIDSSGRITTPYQPAFFARYSNGGLNLPTGYLVWDSTVTNVGSYYSTSTGRFTAPVAGVYLLCYQVQHKGDNATSAYVDLYINGALFRGMRAETPGIANYQTTAASCVVSLAANDYVQIYNSAAAGIFWTDHSAFSGYLLG